MDRRARSGLAGDEDVVALAEHPHAETERLYTPLLADDVLLRVKIVGGLEGKLLGVRRPLELFYRDFERVGFLGHVYVSVGYFRVIAIF